MEYIAAEEAGIKHKISARNLWMSVVSGSRLTNAVNGSSSFRRLNVDTVEKQLMAKIQPKTGKPRVKLGM